MRTRFPLALALFLLVVLIGLGSSGFAQCGDWKSGWRLAGPSNEVGSLIVYDDGSGPALYAGGRFTDTDGVPANHIAKWDGHTWTALGPGLDGEVRSLSVFNDGHGAALYASGEFTHSGVADVAHIAKWDGVRWSSLGSGLDAGAFALAALNEGGHPVLCAGGALTQAGGMSVNNIAKWDGSSWGTFGSGLAYPVTSLASFDDGTGLALYAGGSDVSKWDGTTWSSVGAGMISGANALTVFDDGSGPALYAGTGGVWKLEGPTWVQLGTINGWIDSLITFDDGTGEGLYAGGFNSSGTGVQRWNGTTWLQLYSPEWIQTEVKSLAVFDYGSGPLLFGGAEVYFEPYNLPLFVARWTESTWVPVGNDDGLTNGVRALTVADDGSGPALFAGGNFTAAGNVAASRIAKYDGESWAPLGSGMSGGGRRGTVVQALAEFHEGANHAIWAGGTFTSAGGVPVHNIAQWDGASWSDLGGGVEGFQDVVRCMAVFDDGSGAALYVGGNIHTAGGGKTSNIAKWDGSSWSSLGIGVDGPVNALQVFDDGSGAALYVCGEFAVAGGVRATTIARWNGTSWSAVGHIPRTDARTLAVFDDGSGSSLYAGGGYGSGNTLSKWDGVSWTTLGGLEHVTACGLTSQSIFDDGSGPALYVSLGTCSADESPLLYKWDGQNWTNVDGLHTTGGQILSMAAFQGTHDSGPALYLGSSNPAYFRYVPQCGMAVLQGCGHPGEPFCFGDGSTGACPCGNFGAPGRGCENSHGTGGAVLDSSGWTSVAFDSLVLTARDLPQPTLAIFLQGDLLFAPTAFGDGLRCTGGHNKRLFAKSAVGGVAFAPQPGDPSISTKSASMGDSLSVGCRRLYQVIYRDTDQAFCPFPTGNNWNISSGRQIGWLL